ncbi:hypothetical protein [Pseudofrankia sp. DC12]|uniref:hypothetical protein n=1 Tax=Pseudofrankia sp. DC12 TaxID=683315 RepID=UPI0005F80019|nr:hypothetical protein [Pseudofrankia sp. DC12]
MIDSEKLFVRNYFSTNYLYTARWLSEEARQLEEKLAGVTHYHPQHRGAVISSITSACAFLEAHINEIFLDVVDEQPPWVDHLTADVRDKICWLWTDGKAEENRALAKYNAILIAASLPILDKGQNPYQDAQLVIDIRNVLTHYKVYSLGEKKPHTLSRKFASPQFPLNQLMVGHNAERFPDHILGHGCADWAWRSCKKFADEFGRRLGISLKYQATDLWAEYGPVADQGN